MEKKIELIINNCSECPFLRYNSDYGRSFDSGYDCYKAYKRIIDDYEYDNTNNPKNMCKNGDVPIPIPEWCPL